MINITDSSTACAFCQYERYCGTAVSNMKLAKLGHCKIYNDKANEKIEEVGF